METHSRKNKKDEFLKAPSSSYHAWGASNILISVLVPYKESESTHLPLAIQFKFSN